MNPFQNKPCNIPTVYNKTIYILNNFLGSSTLICAFLIESITSHVKGFDNQEFKFLIVEIFLHVNNIHFLVK